MLVGRQHKRSQGETHVLLLSQRLHLVWLSTSGFISPRTDYSLDFLPRFPQSFLTSGDPHWGNTTVQTVDIWIRPKECDKGNQKMLMWKLGGGRKEKKKDIEGKRRQGKKMGERMEETGKERR